MTLLDAAREALTWEVLNDAWQAALPSADANAMRESILAAITPALEQAQRELTVLRVDSFNLQSVLKHEAQKQAQWTPMRDDEIPSPVTIKLTRSPHPLEQAQRELDEARRELAEQNGTTHALNLAAQVRKLQAVLEQAQLDNVWREWVRFVLAPTGTPGDVSDDELRRIVGAHWDWLALEQTQRMSVADRAILETTAYPKDADGQVVTGAYWCEECQDFAPNHRVNCIVPPLRRLLEQAQTPTCATCQKMLEIHRRTLGWTCMCGDVFESLEAYIEHHEMLHDAPADPGGVS